MATDVLPVDVARTRFESALLDVIQADITEWERVGEKVEFGQADRIAIDYGDNRSQEVEVTDINAPFEPQFAAGRRRFGYARNYQYGEMDAKLLDMRRTGSYQTQILSNLRNRVVERIEKTLSNELKAENIPVYRGYSEGEDTPTNANLLSNLIVPHTFGMYTGLSIGKINQAIRLLQTRTSNFESILNTPYDFTRMPQDWILVGSPEDFQFLVDSEDRVTSSDYVGDGGFFRSGMVDVRLWAHVQQVKVHRDLLPAATEQTNKSVHRCYLMNRRALRWWIQYKDPPRIDQRMDRIGFPWQYSCGLSIGARRVREELIAQISCLDNATPALA